MKVTIKAVFTLVLLFIAGTSLAEERKVVFDLRAGDPGRLEARIVGDIKYMADYYENLGIDFKPVIVISGRAYKFFIDDLADSPYKDEDGIFEIRDKFRPMFKELNEDYGVTFEMCVVGMNDSNIKPESLYSYVNADKLQAVYLIDWQSKGHAYIPVN